MKTKVLHVQEINPDDTLGQIFTFRENMDFYLDFLKKHYELQEIDGKFLCNPKESMGTKRYVWPCIGKNNEECHGVAK